MFHLDNNKHFKIATDISINIDYNKKEYRFYEQSVYYSQVI